MSSKLFNGLTVPALGSSQPVPIPDPKTITFFARDNQTVWVKFPDATEVLISVG
jgi:hypothetical protein